VPRAGQIRLRYAGIANGDGVGIWSAWCNRASEREATAI